MKTGKIVIGILAGAGIGALIGMLYAPEKGSTTRKNIGHKKNDFADSFKGKLNEIVDTYSKKYDKAYNATKNAIAEGEAKISHFSAGFGEKKDITDTIS